MKVTVVYSGTWVADVVKQICGVLSGRGYEVYLTKGNTLKLIDDTLRISHSLCAFHRQGTDYFDLMESRDSPVFDGAEIVKNVTSDPRCRTIIKMQYEKGVTPEKVKPFTYFPNTPKRFDELLEGFRSIHVSAIIRNDYSRGLHFRGELWDWRAEVLKRLEGITSIKKKMNFKIAPIEYYRECANHLIGLSLPGNGNLCHREMEYFGMGVPVIMPKLINSTHDPLIPDYHYISTKNLREASYGEISDQIKWMYEKYKNDKPFLQFISSNAMKWYDNNVRFPMSASLGADLLGFGDLRK